MNWVPWFVILVGIIGAFINYGVRRAIAFMIMLGSGAFCYVALFTGNYTFPIRLLVFTISLLVFLLGLTIWRGNQLWLKHESAVRAMWHDQGWQAAILAYWQIVKREFVPGRAAE